MASIWSMPGAGRVIESGPVATAWRSAIRRSRNEVTLDIGQFVLLAIVMAQKTFDITRYNVTYWQVMHSSTGVVLQARLQCYGSANEEIVISALHPSNKKKTPPTCDMAHNIGYLWVPIGHFQHYVDLLRSGIKTQATLDDSTPENMNLYGYTL